MKCPSCDKTVSHDASKCPQCGEDLEEFKLFGSSSRACPSCESRISTDAARCPQCGEDLEEFKLFGSSSRACPACEGRVSTDATRCPQCGEDLQEFKLFGSSSRECPSCENRISSDAKRCPQCGEDLESFKLFGSSSTHCRECGNVVSTDAERCPQCGEDLKAFKLFGGSAPPVPTRRQREAARQEESSSSSADELTGCFVKLALWIGGILFAIWLAVMALIITVVLSPVWLGAVVMGMLTGFILANRAADQVPAGALEGMPVEERQKGKKVRTGLEAGWVRAACRVSPHMLLMVLVTAVYVLALTLWPLWMSPDKWTRLALGVAAVAGIILGTWAGRSVFGWQYEHRLLRRLLPENESIPGSAAMLTGFGVTAMLALGGVWFVAMGEMGEMGGRWNLFSGSLREIANVSSSPSPTPSSSPGSLAETENPQLTRTEPERTMTTTPTTTGGARSPLSIISPPPAMGGRGTTAPGVVWPEGFTVYEPSVSPDGSYGVLVPDQKTFIQGRKGQNQLAELKTGRIIASLDAESWFEDTVPAMDHSLPQPVWSRDSRVLAWFIQGRWVPKAFNVLSLSQGHVEWQSNLLAEAHRAILKRTREAEPEVYAAAKLENQGNGSAYPDGFSVNLDLPKNGFSLPLTCPVTLTANPKEIPGRVGLRSSLSLTLDPFGQVEISGFRILEASAPPPSAARVIPAPTTAPMSAPWPALVPGGPVVPEHVRDFVRQRVRAEASRDLDRILQNYAEQVTYWDQGTVAREAIRKDKAAYFQRWPVGREELQEPVEAGPAGPGDDWKAVFRTRFRVENPQTGIAVEGLQETRLTVRFMNGVFKITSEAGEVLEKRREEKRPDMAVAPVVTGAYPGERFPETRTQTLSAEALRRLGPDDLRYAINEMFARHGADFEKADLKKHFRQFAWYQPRTGLSFDEIEKKLFTPLERDNLKRLAEARSGARPPGSGGTMPAESTSVPGSAPAPAARREGVLRPGPNSRVVSPKDLKTLAGQPVKDTWFHGNFIVSNITGNTVTMYPMSAGGLLRSYSTEIHATFHAGAPDLVGRETLPLDPSLSTIGLQIPASSPLRLIRVTRTTRPGTNKEIVTVLAER